MFLFMHMKVLMFREANLPKEVQLTRGRKKATPLVFHTLLLLHPKESSPVKPRRLEGNRILGVHGLGSERRQEGFRKSNARLPPLPYFMGHGHGWTAPQGPSRKNIL